MDSVRHAGGNLRVIVTLEVGGAEHGWICVCFYICLTSYAGVARGQLMCNNPSLGGEIWRGGGPKGRRAKRRTRNRSNSVASENSIFYGLVVCVVCVSWDSRIVT